MSSVVRIWWLVLPSMGSHFVVSTFSFPSLGSIFGSIFGGSSVGSYFLEMNTPRNVEMLPHTTECGQTQKRLKISSLLVHISYSSVHISCAIWMCNTATDPDTTPGHNVNPNLTRCQGTSQPPKFGMSSTSGEKKALWNNLIVSLIAFLA